VAIVVAVVVAVIRDEESADEDARESLARAGPAGPPRAPCQIAVLSPSQLLRRTRLSGLETQQPPEVSVPREYLPDTRH
jgi:hypothetical protein